MGEKRSVLNNLRIVNHRKKRALCKNNAGRVRRVGIILAFSIVISMFPIAIQNPQAVEEPGKHVLVGIIGDADTDSKITVKDATRVQKHTAKILSLNETQQKLVDFLSKPGINIKCATYIQKYIARINLYGTEGEKVGQKLFGDDDTNPAQTEPITPITVPSISSESIESTSSTSETSSAASEPEESSAPEEQVIENTGTVYICLSDVRGFTSKLGNGILVWSIELLSDLSADPGVSIDQTGKVIVDRDVPLGTTFTVKVCIGKSIETWKCEVVLPVNETFFPDEIFRTYVDSKLYHANPVFFTQAETESVNTIDVWDTNIITSRGFSERKDIYTVQGIEYFTALTYLNCGFIRLESLDVSKNTELTVLNCGWNQLTELDVSKNVELTMLDCSWNQLTELDVSGNTGLTSLNCYNNQLELLLGGSNKLTWLNCSWNRMTELDLSKFTGLTELDCRNNRLTALNLSGNTELLCVECNDNELTNLNLSSNAKLIVLDCGVNQLSCLDVSNNNLLICLDCDGNQLTELDISKNAALKWLNCGGNRIVTLDISELTSLIDEYCIDFNNNGMENLIKNNTNQAGMIFQDFYYHKNGNGNPPGSWGMENVKISSET